jgi:hypothetical protein
MSAVYLSTTHPRKIYLEPTIEGCFRWCGTSYIHPDHLICRRKLLRHIDHPRSIPSRQIENRLRTSPRYMYDIAPQKCLERLMSMIYHIRILSTPLAAIWRGQSAPNIGEVTSLSVMCLKRQRRQRRSRIGSKIRAKDIQIQLCEHEIVHFQGRQG